MEEENPMNAGYGEAKEFEHRQVLHQINLQGDFKFEVPSSKRRDSGRIL